MEENFLYYIEHSIRIHWEEPALTDYQGQTHTFGDVAHHIARLHLLFEESGIRRGDKIALCSRNQTNWGIAFLAILSYGAVAVPILHEFKADNIRHIVNHSEARILFAGTPIWEELQKKKCRNRKPSSRWRTILFSIIPIRHWQKLTDIGKSYSGRNIPPPCVRKISITSRINLTSWP
ncbi:MAG: AMP-binding protein [Odoribacter splanchnicus]